MNAFSLSRSFACAALLAAGVLPARAQLFVTEVAAWGSGASYAADWFELTNTGSSAVDITGWKIDDNSESPVGAVALRGVTSIAPGRSVVFLEGLANGSTDTAVGNAFKAAWFGGSVPSGLTLGFYGGSGVGLSSTFDAVNIYSGANVIQAQVRFATSTAVSPFLTFDNSARIDGATISALSSVGINGAFASADSTPTTTYVGSPGFAPVPEPESYALVTGVAASAFCSWRRWRRVRTA
jgi:hypothetical protein